MYFDTVKLVGLTDVLLPILNLNPAAPYILKSVDGLGPPEIDLSIIQTLQQGGIYQGSRPQGREVVLLIRLNPDYTTGQTVADLRDELYGMITPFGAQVPRIELLAGGSTVVQADAYVKKFEIVPFSKDPSVQITYGCVQPFLSAPEAVVVDVAPFVSSRPVMINPGNAPTGFHMELTFNANKTNLTIALYEDPSVFMTINHDFDTTDILTIDTTPGSREISLYRSPSLGVGGNLIGDLTGDSTWIMLSKGDNELTLSTSSVGRTINSLYFTPQYWGV